MHIVKNFDQLATSQQRKIVLELVECALGSIKPQGIMEKNFFLQDNILYIQKKLFPLASFQRIFLIGFGKGSADICKIIEEKLGAKLTDGYDIDVIEKTFSKIHYTKGTHPLPSQANINYTKTVLEKITNLTEKDLVLVVVCGGGSVLFEAPYRIDLEKLNEVNKALLASGATISEMNVIRKHLSNVKGGRLAKHLYPATVASLIFSDVPGNDLSVIASAPTVKNPTTMDDVKTILEKYQIAQIAGITSDDFTQTPTDAKYFKNVSNLLVLSNQTALQAMQQKSKELGYDAFIFTDKLQGDAKIVGKELLEQTKPGQILLAAGETTVKVQGKGQGGRNQTLVLAALEYLVGKTIICSFDSDGWDFYGYAGAVGDSETIKKMKQNGLDAKQFLDNDDSYSFFEKIGDGIDTGKLESNVSDLMIVMKG